MTDEQEKVAVMIAKAGAKKLMLFQIGLVCPFLVPAAKALFLAAEVKQHLDEPKKYG